MQFVFKHFVHVKDPLKLLYSLAFDESCPNDYFHGPMSDTTISSDLYGGRTPQPIRLAYTIL